MSCNNLKFGWSDVDRKKRTVIIRDRKAGNGQEVPLIEGISRLFEKGYSVMEVAVMSGHKDMNMLKRYTHLKPVSLHRGAA